MYTGLNTLALWKSSQSFLENCLLGYKILSSVQFSSVRLLSHVQLFVTPWIAARQASLSITNSELLKLMSIELVMLSNHHPLSSLSLPDFSLSQHQGLYK